MELKLPPSKERERDRGREEGREGQKMKRKKRQLRFGFRAAVLINPDDDELTGRTG